MLRYFIPIILAASAVAAQEEPSGFRCIGTEPFWDLAIEDDAATFQRMDHETVEFRIPHKAVAEGRDWPIAYSLIGDFDTALAILRPLACGDGTSGTEFPFTIDLLTQDGTKAIVLSGCCRAGAAKK